MDVHDNDASESSQPSWGKMCTSGTLLTLMLPYQLPGESSVYYFTKTSKDNEDPSWSTSFKTRRTQKTSSALEVLWKTLFVL
ncbi:hypothetical protein Tco_1059780 [Tanacetum coccineum]